MSDRRYSDDEVSAIFARAAEVQDKAQRQLPANQGMSLAQLQEIGREAGIAPELVAQAARELAQPAPPRVPTLFGIPIGVARTVELGRTLTDDQWDRLVVELRETFEARGTITVQGSFRTWSNGNLNVLVEPSTTGHRVRFRTVKADARGLLSAGAAMMAVSAVIVLTTLVIGSPNAGATIASSTTVGAIGALLAASGGAALPVWLRRRREQMEELAAKLLRDG
jgi:hypothetical protein